MSSNNRRGDMKRGRSRGQSGRQSYSDRSEKTRPPKEPISDVPKRYDYGTNQDRMGTGRGHGLHGGDQDLAKIHRVCTRSEEHYPEVYGEDTDYYRPPVQKNINKNTYRALKKFEEKEMEQIKDKYHIEIDEIPPEVESEQITLLFSSDRRDVDVRQGVEAFYNLYQRMSHEVKNLPKGFAVNDSLKVYVYAHNITKINVSGIVNAANGDLYHAGGVAKAIADGAGQDLIKSSKAVVEDHKKAFDTSDVIVTPSGLLPCDVVLHAVGPRWPGTYAYKGNQARSKSSREKECIEELRATFTNVLWYSDMLGLDSIAVPPISSGIFGVPHKHVAQEMVNAILTFGKCENSKTVEEVHLVDIGEEILQMVSVLLEISDQVARLKLEEVLEGMTDRLDLSAKRKRSIKEIKVRKMKSYLTEIDHKCSETENQEVVKNLDANSDLEWPSDSQRPSSSDRDNKQRKRGGKVSQRKAGHELSKQHDQEAKNTGDSRSAQDKHTSHRRNKHDRQGSSPKEKGSYPPQKQTGSGGRAINVAEPGESAQKLDLRKEDKDVKTIFDTPKESLPGIRSAEKTDESVQGSDSANKCGRSLVETNSEIQEQEAGKSGKNIKGCNKKQNNTCLTKQNPNKDRGQTNVRGQPKGKGQDDVGHLDRNGPLEKNCKPESTGQPGSTGGKDEPESKGQSESEGQQGGKSQSESKGQPGSIGKPEGTGQPENKGQPESKGQPEGKGQQGPKGQPENKGQQGPKGQPENKGQQGGKDQPEGTGQQGGKGQPEGTGQLERKGGKDHPKSKGQPEGIGQPEDKGQPESKGQQGGKGQPESKGQQGGKGQPESRCQPKSKGHPGEKGQPGVKTQPESICQPKGKGQKESKGQAERSDQLKSKYGPQSKGQAESKSQQHSKVQ